MTLGRKINPKNKKNGSVRVSHIMVTRAKFKVTWEKSIILFFLSCNIFNTLYANTRAIPRSYQKSRWIASKLRMLDTILNEVEISKNFEKS